jgi:hypothetical protein
MSIFSSIGSFAADNAGSLLQTGATLGSAGLNYAAAGQAADVSREAANNANELRRQMYNTSRQDLAPYRAAGYGALDVQSDLLGLGNNPELFKQANEWVDDDTTMGQGLGTTFAWHQQRNTPSYQKYVDARGDQITNRLRQTPGYQFRMDEGVQARDRSAAARGMALSGAQQKALTEYGQGLADQTYGQQLNRLASLAGTGQTATTNVAQMGTNMAQAQGQNLMGAAQSRGSSYLTGANQAGNAMNSLAYIWG